MSVSSVSGGNGPPSSCTSSLYESDEITLPYMERVNIIAEVGAKDEMKSKAAHEINEAFDVSVT